VRGGLGRDKAQRLVKELIEAGYIVRTQDRNASSKQFGTYEYHVFDLPQHEPIAEPEPENPVAAKNKGNRAGA